MSEPPNFPTSSYLLTRIPNDLIRNATSRPIRPNPTTANVFPYSSVPLNSLRFHSLFFILATAGTTGRANVPIKIHVNSHADIELPPGVLNEN